MDDDVLIDERLPRLPLSTQTLNLGWRCPSCGKGLAPDVKECSCVALSEQEKIMLEDTLWDTPPEAYCMEHDGDLGD